MWLGLQYIILVLRLTDSFLHILLFLSHFIFVCFLLIYLLILALLVDVCEKQWGNVVTGWEGQQCDRPCNEKFYGQDCNSPCRCLNNAACNPQNGVCFILLTFSLPCSGGGVSGVFVIYRHSALVTLPLQNSLIVLFGKLLVSSGISGNLH
jgi:hypothetical protein